MSKIAIMVFFLHGTAAVGRLEHQKMASLSSTDVNQSKSSFCTKEVTEDQISQMLDLGQSLTSLCLAKNKEDQAEVKIDDLNHIIMNSRKNIDPLLPMDAYRMSYELLKNIKMIHDQGQLHRDIRAENILVEYDKSGKRHARIITNSSAAWSRKSHDVESLGFTLLRLHSKFMNLPDPIHKLDSLKSRRFLESAKSYSELDGALGTRCARSLGNRPIESLICQMLNPDEVRRISVVDALDRMKQICSEPEISCD